MADREPGGAASPGSDYDLGLYYEEDVPLDIDDLRNAIAPLADDPFKTTVTPVGGWGRWINGGGWLSILGQKVDLLYRDLTRVRAVITECEAGEISMNYRPGHPHGFCSAIWIGEVAVCLPVRDDDGVIAELKTRAWPFPIALRHAIISPVHVNFRGPRRVWRAELADQKRLSLAKLVHLVPIVRDWVVPRFASWVRGRH